MPGDRGLNIPAAQVREALAGSGALFIDMKAEFDILYGDYLSEAVRLSLAGFVAIVLLLAATLRFAVRFHYALFFHSGDEQPDADTLTSMAVANLTTSSASAPLVCRRYRCSKPLASPSAPAPYWPAADRHVRSAAQRQEGQMSTLRTVDLVRGGDTLLVLLPGAYMQPENFVAAGFPRSAGKPPAGA
ncbi:MAG: hypothetical protein IPL58_12910 [Betaproteobacteria bacterium]|uniref:Uncharacterized protein n=1 Tax=Candidatus Proximibacter danicus TaxID=2954365 RepID=A0A9D7K1U3_9PROT|nr:hypothetical protein [Candidatus Proximibacter danicus]